MHGLQNIKILVEINTIIKQASLLFVTFFVCFWRDSPQWARASSFTRFLDHTQRRTTVGRLLWTSDRLVAETSTWPHTTLTDKHPCLSVGFEPTISAGDCLLLFKRTLRHPHFITWTGLAFYHMICSKNNVTMQTLPTKHIEFNVKVIYEQFKPPSVQSAQKQLRTVFCTGKSNFRRSDGVKGRPVSHAMCRNQGM